MDTSRKSRHKRPRTETFELTVKVKVRCFSAEGRRAALRDARQNLILEEEGVAPDASDYSAKSVGSARVSRR